MSDEVKVFRVLTANGTQALRAGGGSALYDNLRGAKGAKAHFDRSCSYFAPHRVQSLSVGLVPGETGSKIGLVWEDVPE